MPGLAADFGGYPDEAFPPAPALSTWISRARVDAYAPTLTEHAITDLLGIGDGTATPIAALSYLQDFGELPPTYCLRADPVHLRADTNGLILFDAASFELDEDDSRALVETLNDHLVADGCRLVQGHPHRWYLLVEEPLDLVTTALPLQRGTSISSAPFTGKDAALWMARLNEIQMLMHSHPVNQARAALGQAAVNSVWLWGAGGLSTAGNTKYTHVSTDNVIAQGAASRQKLATSGLEENGQRFLSVKQAGDNTLLILETCRSSAAYDNFNAWRAGVEDMEDHWIAPLLAALEAGRLDTLTLLPLNGRRYAINKRRLSYFWKRVVAVNVRRGFRSSTSAKV